MGILKFTITIYLKQKYFNSIPIILFRIHIWNTIFQMWVFIPKDFKKFFTKYCLLFSIIILIWFYNVLSHLHNILFKTIISKFTSLWNDQFKKNRGYNQSLLGVMVYILWTINKLKLKQNVFINIVVLLLLLINIYFTEKYSINVPWISILLNYF